VLVEGGGELLGSLFDTRLVDEVHAFIAPRIVGGTAASSPIAGLGIDRIASALKLTEPQWRAIGQDLYLYGRVAVRPD
jgi:diaminohydroxyphosphoribosylaminopyrimidine deaminase/5-amino-6-(5-phosphoribosylamino)uracil reductase